MISCCQYGLVFLVVAWVACCVGCSEEQAKWNAARAKVHAEAGRNGAAISLLEEAIVQDPNNGKIRLQLAKNLAMDGQGKLAVNHCDIYINQNPSDLNAYFVRSACNQYLGRFKESLADYIKSISGHLDRSTGELNNLAYYRCLARVKLGLAATNISTAIEKVEARYWGSPMEVPLGVRGMVAASLLSRRVDEQSFALEHLDRKILGYENELGERQAALNGIIVTSISKKEIDAFPLPKETEASLLPLRDLLEARTSSLVILLATRALVLEDLKMIEKCDLDRFRISELGYSFEEVVKKLPDDFECIGTLNDVSAYLDTRGFILSRLPWKNASGSINFPKLMEVDTGQPIVVSSFSEALDDMNVAVLAAEIHLKVLDSSLYNSADIPAESIPHFKREVKHTVAVLLNHRLELYRRGGLDKLADEDQERIIELGFKAGCCLY